MEGVRIDKGKKKKKKNNKTKAEAEVKVEAEDYGMNILARCSYKEKDGNRRILDFHMVDVDNKQLCLDYFPSLTCGTAVGGGHMLMLNVNMLLLGGVWRNPNNNYTDDDDEKNKMTHIHTGSSRFSLTANTWYPGKIPFNRTMSNPAFLRGIAICCFGYPNLLPEIKFGSTWLKLSLPLHLQPPPQVSIPVLPDPNNSRFLVYLHDCPALYAFYPPTIEDYLSGHYGRWEPIPEFKGFWSKTIVLLDGILFLHEWNFPKLLLAYDLTANVWLKVDAHLTNVTIQVRVFQSIFALPAKGLICLASCVFPMRDSPRFDFLRLKVHRTAPSTIKLTALDYQSYRIPSSTTACDFLML